MAEEADAVLDATDKEVSIGGAGLAAAAIELRLVDELRMFRYPVVIGGGTPFLPPVTENVPLDLRDHDVRLARDLRALPARPRRVGLTRRFAREGRGPSRSTLDWRSAGLWADAIRHR